MYRIDSKYHRGKLKYKRKTVQRFIKICQEDFNNEWKVNLIK